MSVAGQTEALALPICEKLGLELWDVRFEKEGSVWYLRVLIDREGGVDMDVCEEFSRQMNDLLDEKDPIPQSYVFEAGSPGLGRRLLTRRHFELCSGEEARVKLYAARDGVKNFVGLISDCSDEGFTLILATDENGGVTDSESFKYDECASVNLNDDAYLL